MCALRVSYVEVFCRSVIKLETFENAGVIDQYIDWSRFLNQSLEGFFGRLTVS